MRAAAWAIAALLLALPPLLGAGSLALTLLAQVAATGVVCLSLGWLMGQGGLYSFGHAVHAGLGGFAVLGLLNVLPAGHSAAWVALLPLAGALAGGLSAALLGALATRHGGLVFAMITLGLGELVYALALMMPEWSGGEAGLRADRARGTPVAGWSFGPPAQAYALVIAWSFAAAALAQRLPRTPLGLVLAAVRDQPARCAGLGHDPRRVRWTAYVIAGLLAGLGGGLLALLFENVSAEALSTHRSGLLLLFTFVGGAAGLAGPLLGAALMVLGGAWLAAWTPAWGLYVGLLFLAAVVAAPEGLAAALQRLHRLPARRWLLLPPIAAATVGALLAVEMLYHRQLDTALGPLMQRGPWQVDTGSAAPWALALGLALAGGAAACWAWRRWR